VINDGVELWGCQGRSPSWRCRRRNGQTDESPGAWEVSGEAATLAELMRALAAGLRGVPLPGDAAHAEARDRLVAYCLAAGLFHRLDFLFSQYDRPQAMTFPSPSFWFPKRLHGRNHEINCLPPPLFLLLARSTCCVGAFEFLWFIP
jgi:hypothetical protein